MCSPGGTCWVLPPRPCPSDQVSHVWCPQLAGGAHLNALRPSAGLLMLRRKSKEKGPISWNRPIPSEEQPGPLQGWEGGRGRGAALGGRGRAPASARQAAQRRRLRGCAAGGGGSAAGRPGGLGWRWWAQRPDGGPASSPSPPSAKMPKQPRPVSRALCGGLHGRHPARRQISKRPSPLQPDQQRVLVWVVFALNERVEDLPARLLVHLQVPAAGALWGPPWHSRHTSRQWGEGS